MAVKSVYLPLPTFSTQDTIEITGDEHRHLVVTRAQAGEPVEVFDGKGTVWAATVASITKKETLVRVAEQRFVEPEPHQVVLGQALIRTAAFELVLEKAVEIGVNRIVPFVAARSNVASKDRSERWARIAVEAAKQSKRYHLPSIEEPCGFEDVLSIPAQTKIVFAERAVGSLQSALAGSPALYLIGPEGGWTDTELESAAKSGFKFVTLGSGILKAETAAIAGGALIRYELGEMGQVGW